ncbi:MAG: M48 family peptidase [Sphingobacteriales bacterium]|nr:MAG: M48 family peptidase [Sphingobacteriales bacterium]
MRGALRYIIAIVMAIGALISYFTLRQDNPVTGEKQHIGISTEQEVALGLQAAPQMSQEYGGEISDPQILAGVNQIGQRIAQQSDATKAEYQYQFHVLADNETINAFALPGGQVFITMGLLKLLQTPGELAGVLGHEIGHVIARHSAEQMAKTQLTQGLSGAAVMATYDPSNPSTQAGPAVAALIGNLVNMKFGRDDELEADRLGVRLIGQAGYDPNAMINVMKILQQAAGSNSQPEFFSTHPNPENRITMIQTAIEKEFPSGVPANLEK